MKNILLIMALSTTINSAIIFDFTLQSSIHNWKIVDDIVMGGRSSSTFSLDADGFGIFEGRISIENKGGFSSVYYVFDKINVRKYTRIVLKARGDGKSYQFRIKQDSTDYYSYITPFSTTGEWQEIEIPIGAMYPSFRGRKLDMPNFSSETIEEIAFLIANKKAEDFKLMIDKIELK